MTEKSSNSSCRTAPAVTSWTISRNCKWRHGSSRSTFICPAPEDIKCLTPLLCYLLTIRLCCGDSRITGKLVYFHTASQEEYSLTTVTVSVTPNSFTWSICFSNTQMRKWRLFYLVWGWPVYSHWPPLGGSCSPPHRSEPSGKISCRDTEKKCHRQVCHRVVISMFPDPVRRHQPA